MKPPKQPTQACPVCGKPYFTPEQAQACGDKDVQERQPKRKLKLINSKVKR